MTTDVPRRQHDDDLLSVILRDAGLGPASAIRVTGKDGLGPLIWLCRHGFEDVAYVRLGGGGRLDCGDALLVPHCDSPGELEQLLGARRLVREGGVLIVQTRCAACQSDPALVYRLLDQAGFCVERRVTRRSRDVIVARLRLGPALRRAA